MEKNDWYYDIMMSDEIDLEEEDIGEEGDCVEDINYSVDCSMAFNTSKVFNSRDDVLTWARSVAHDNGFVVVIMRSGMASAKVGTTSYVIIGCQRSGKYRSFKKGIVPTTGFSRKCDCPFKLRAKPGPGGQGWIVKLICGTHNHRLAKSLCGHPYAGRLTQDEKIIVGDMTRSMVKPKNILLTLKDHDANNYTTLKQIYNARYAHRTRIRGDKSEMQQLMKLLQRDMYIYWHRMKEENVVRDLFWAHPDAVKLSNSYHLVFLIDSTYKTNKYRLSLLDIVSVTPTGMTFSAAFAYLEAERTNNLVWALERFRGIFFKSEFFPQVVVTDRDATLMNAIKVIFPECTTLLCRFHIDKNVKAKCKTYIRQSNAWDYVMDAWGTVVDCSNQKSYDDCLRKFEIACSPWPTFVDYVKETWLDPHKENFVTAWTNKVMHLGNTTSNRVETAHSTLKRLLQNSIGDLCSVWDAMNNMMTLQHTEIKASLERSTHVIGHVFKVTLYKRLIGMVSRYALNQIAAEYERVHYAGKNPSRCGCVMRTTHGLPCACELAKVVQGSIPLSCVHAFWRRLNFSDQGDPMSEEIQITEEMEAISKRFDKLDLCGKMTLKTKLKELAFPDQASMHPPPPEKVKTKGAPKNKHRRHEISTKRDPSYFEYVDQLHSVQNSCSTQDMGPSINVEIKQTNHIPILDQFVPFMHKFIINISDVKADGNYGYRVIAALLGYGEDCWPVVRNHLLKELSDWSDQYIALLGGFPRFDQLKRSLLVDGLSQVTIDKWMDITDMGYVIASRYNVILASLSLKQSMTFFPLRGQPSKDPSMHRIMCIGHVFGNHFVQVELSDDSPIPPTALLWSKHSFTEAKQWPNYYRHRQWMYAASMPKSQTFVDLG